MLIGGDLYGQEEAFFEMVASRQDDYIENWLKKVQKKLEKVEKRVELLSCLLIQFEISIFTEVFHYDLHHEGCGTGA